MIKSKYLQFIWLLAIFALILGTPNRQAHAYLDPGSSSFLIQIIAAGLLAILMTLRLYSTRLIVLFRKLFGLKSEVKEDDDIKGV